MSLRDKMKELLFEQENNSKQDPGTQPAGQAAMQSSVASHVAASPVENNGEIEIDEKLLDVIEQKIKEANIPGPDYLELKEAAEEKTFVADEPDEAKRWRQAYRNMRAYFPQANITKAKIISAIDHYIGIVREEIKIGRAELKNLINRDVVQAKTSITALETEISKLEKELEKKKAERENKLAKIQESEVNYKHQEQVFSQTTDFVIKMLEGDKEKINTYIAE